MSLFAFFISLLIVAQHVSGNHVPIISSYRLCDVMALCWYVPWLRGGWMSLFVFFIFVLIVAQHVSGQLCAHHQQLTTA